MEYYKKHQRGEFWNYYKLMPDRTPPVCERVIFLNKVPVIDFSEYDLLDVGSLIDYRAIQENGQPITAVEYEMAYQQATKGEFKLYINGKLNE